MQTVLHNGIVTISQERGHAMVTKSTPNVNYDGYTVSLSNDSGNTDNSMKKIYQKPSSEKDINNTMITDQAAWERIFSWRTFTVGILFLSYTFNTMPVVTMSISLLCMCGPIKGPINDTQNNTSLSLMTTHTEFPPLDNLTKPQDQVYEFNWDPEIRGIIISGYLFTIFLSPQLSSVIRGYIGNKMTLTISTIFLAFLSFVSPIAARINVYLFLAIRIISGLCIHTNVPISVDTLAWWIPAKEKLTSSTIIASGWIVGASLGSVTAGYICTTGVDNGWPLQFYFHGILFVVWTIVWHGLSSRKPENHPYISEKEKAYILACRIGMSQAKTKEADSTPYRIVLTSRPVLAYIANCALYMCTISLILTCIPLYLTSVLKFSLQDAGSVYSVMVILRLPGALLWSVFGNWLLGLKNMTTNKGRKICCGLGQGLATVFFIGVSFMDESHRWAAIVLLSASVISFTFGMTMFSVIPLDMAPRYAGFISGIGMTIGNLVSITSPVSVTAITQQGTFEQWRVVWITMALINLVSGLVFLIFGNASLQPWALPKSAPTSVKVSKLSSSDMKLGNDSSSTGLLNSQLPK